MLPLMATLVMQAAGGKSLGRTMSVVSLPAVLGPILGPVLGGVILNWLDWRWLFWVNVPFCVVGFVLAWKLLPADQPARRPLDLVGFLLLVPGHRRGPLRAVQRQRGRAASAGRMCSRRC